MTRSRRTLEFLAAALCLFAAFDYGGALQRLEFFIFQTRDLHRAARILTGDQIFFGPEMTGGGNLPGPLFYYLLAPALKIWPNWSGGWYLLLAMFVAAAIAGWWYYRNHLSAACAFLWLTLFALQGQTHRFLHIFLNVSYLFPFAVGAVAFGCAAFGRGTLAERRRAFVLSCLFVGLGVQLHFSIAIILAALLFMQAFAPVLKLPRLELRGVMLGLGAFLLPLIPFAIWLVFARAGLSLGQVPPMPGRMELAPMSLVQLLFAFPMKLQNVPLITASAIPAVLPLIGLAALLPKGKASPPSQDPSHSLIKPALIMALFAFIPFAYAYYVPIGHRYAMPFYLVTLALTILLFHNYIISRRLPAYNILAGIMLAAMMIYFAAAHSDQISIELCARALTVILVPAVLCAWPWRRDSAAGRMIFLALALSIGITFMQSKIVGSRDLTAGPVMMPTNGQWQMILGKIYRATGWSGREALHRIFFVNHHLEQDPRLAYEGIVKRSPIPSETRPDIDGYFVSVQRSGKGLTPESASAWLLTQNLPPEIKLALQNYELFLLPPETSTMFIVPYRVLSTAHLPQHFHDDGEGYEPQQVERALGAITSESGAVKLSDGRLLFKWNECPHHEDFCSTGAIIGLEQDGETWKIHVLSVGGAISQSSPWISPAWTQAWISPYIEVKCGNQTVKFEIASSLGFNRDYAFEADRPILMGNNSFKAPFKRDFEIKCPKGLSEISVGRASSTVETIYEVKQLPAARLSLAL